jgi:hypothetical protein
MKKTWVLLFIIIFTSVFAQKKKNWNNTFIYAVQLPKKLDCFAGISIMIKYKGEPLISKTKNIGGKNVKIASEFYYNAQKSNKIGSMNLPFQLQENTYYWLIDSDIVIEMAAFPERFKIDVVTANLKTSKYYKLPEIFDLISDNSLNIAYLQSLSNTKREQLLKEKSWTLSVSSKEKTENEVVIDTILTYSLRGTIPNGILKVVTDINSQDHTVQEFTIENCYFIDDTLLIPIKSKRKIIGRKPDECYENYTTIDGKICSASGCITGTGTGLCAKIKTSKTKYILTLIIEP